MTKLQKLAQYCVILSTILNILNFYWNNKLLLQDYIEQMRQEVVPSLTIETNQEQYIEQ